MKGNHTAGRYFKLFGENRHYIQEPERESHKTRASFILSNPFYIGLFKYGGELHEGKHEPIISKKLFDEAQEMLKQRGTT